MAPGTAAAREEEHTLLIPLVHRVSCPLSAVLHVPEFGEGGARDAEHPVVPCQSPKIRIVGTRGVSYPSMMA
jgi:hypothetical protein